MTTELILPPEPLLVENQPLIVPQHPDDKNKTICVLLGADVLVVIRNLVSTSTGKPKSAVIKTCFGITTQEKDVEFAPLPANPGDYPTFAVRTFVGSREFFAAQVYAVHNKMRLGIEENILYVALGFNPAKLTEGQ